MLSSHNLLYTEDKTLCLEQICDILREFGNSSGFELAVGFDDVLSVLGPFFSFVLSGFRAFLDDVFRRFRGLYLLTTRKTVVVVVSTSQKVYISIITIVTCIISVLYGTEVTILDDRFFLIFVFFAALEFFLCDDRGLFLFLTEAGVEQPFLYVAEQVRVVTDERARAVGFVSSRGPYFFSEVEHLPQESEHRLQEYVFDLGYHASQFHVHFAERYG